MGDEREPFWEALYRDEAADAWGAPSENLTEFVGRAPGGAWVLDAGCGEGRNALFLAERGFRVRAFDHSTAAIAKLETHARARGLSVESWVGELAEFEFDRDYGLIVASGILQFVPAAVGDRFLSDARLHTVQGGAHVLGVFTDALPPPEDLAPFVQRLYGEDELRGLYADWEILRARSYLKEDEHPGGIHHRHAIGDLVARRPRAVAGA
jgi:tellurite methyltransferase